MSLNLNNLPLNRFGGHPKTPSGIYIKEGSDFSSAPSGSPFEVNLYDAINDAIEEGVINTSGSAATDTDLSVTRNTISVTVLSSTGEDAVLPEATTLLAGVLSAADKTKLDGLDVTDLTVTTGSSTLTINSSTGTNATLSAATTSLAGVMTAADKTKLNALPSTIDGSETKVSAGTNVTVTGAGTIASPYVINSTATGGTTSNWFTTIDNITLFATANPTTWITEVNPQEYTIVVPINQRLERIAYLSEVGVNRNSTTNQTIFNINTSATANTNTTLLNTFTPTLSMNTSTGNVVPVGIGGSPSVSVSTPSGGIRTITIQGNTNITEGQSRIQINDLTV